METGRRSEHLGRAQKVVTGPIIDSGPDHITVRDDIAAEEFRLRIDDRTGFSWLDKAHEGRLTDTAIVRAGFFIAYGVHNAVEIIVLDPGRGVQLDGTFRPHVH